MGWASRLNQRPSDGSREMDALIALFRAKLQTFPTRALYEAHCDAANLTDAERIYLETLLPAHLTVQDAT